MMVQEGPSSVPGQRMTCWMGHVREACQRHARQGRLEKRWLLRRPRLKYWMDYCQEHPEEISKVASVQKKVRAPYAALFSQVLKAAADAWRACKARLVLHTGQLIHASAG